MKDSILIAIVIGMLIGTTYKVIESRKEIVSKIEEACVSSVEGG